MRISTPDLSLQLKRFLGTRGLPPLHNLDETTVGVIVLADLTKDQDTRESRSRHFWLSLTSTAAVGTRSAVGLLNPQGSGVTAVVTEASVRPLIGSEGEIWIAIPLSFSLNGAGRDVFQITGNLGRCGLFETADAAAFSAAEVVVDHFDTTVLNVQRFTFDNVILHEGFGLMLVNTPTNAALRGSFRWTEQPSIP